MKSHLSYKQHIYSYHILHICGGRIHQTSESIVFIDKLFFLFWSEPWKGVFYGHRFHRSHWRNCGYKDQDERKPSCITFKEWVFVHSGAKRYYVKRKTDKFHSIKLGAFHSLQLASIKLKWSPEICDSISKCFYTFSDAPPPQLWTSKYIIYIQAKTLLPFKISFYVILEF